MNYRLLIPQLNEKYIISNDVYQNLRRTYSDINGVYYEQTSQPAEYTQALIFEKLIEPIFRELRTQRLPLELQEHICSFLDLTRLRDYILVSQNINCLPIYYSKLALETKNTLALNKDNLYIIIDGAISIFNSQHEIKKLKVDDCQELQLYNNRLYFVARERLYDYDNVDIREHSIDNVVNIQLSDALIIITATDIILFRLEDKSYIYITNSESVSYAVYSKQSGICYLLRAGVLEAYKPTFGRFKKEVIKTKQRFIKLVRAGFDIYLLSDEFEVYNFRFPERKLQENICDLASDNNNYYTLDFEGNVYMNTHFETNQGLFIISQEHNMCLCSYKGDLYLIKDGQITDSIFRL